jgi:SAM-dependent methyltransferase
MVKVVQGIKRKIATGLRRQLSMAPSKPFAHVVDEPQPGREIAAPFVAIRGWVACSKGSRIESLVLCSSSGDYEHALGLVPRPDVEAVYPNNSVTGFDQVLPSADLPSERVWRVQVTVNGRGYGVPLEFSVSREFLEVFRERKRRKLERIRSVLWCPHCQSDRLSASLDKSLQCLACGSFFNMNQNRYDFLTRDLQEKGAVKAAPHVSAHSYDAVARRIIDERPTGLILDAGSGLREAYYPNVVNFEIADYSTTDVLGIGERMPFKTGSFDAAFSLSVLEHVKNPFDCASELIRVLKPGGILYAAVPFLQPFHGYPDHYYNMTTSGLRNLFADPMRVVECGVLRAGLPIWCLSWFLNSYIEGLPTSLAKKFKNMRVRELIADPTSYLGEDFVKQLSPETNETLACANYLIARKV